MDNIEKVKARINICSKNKLKTESQMKEFLIKRYPEKSDKLTFNKIQLIDAHFGIVELLRQLVTYESKDGTSKFAIKLNDKIKKCKTVFCLSDQVFGENLGIYYLYFLDVFHFNLSYLSNPENFYSKESMRKYYKLTNYTKLELEQIYKALSMFPKEAFKNIDFGYHMKKSDFYNNQTIANASINIFKLFSDLKPSEQIQTIVHELGHVFSEKTYMKLYGQFDKVGADGSDEWLKLSNWKIDPNRPRWLAIFEGSTDLTRRNFVSHYAKKNPSEDFAETFTSYILNPKYLYLVAPLKFKFMNEKIFDKYTYENNQCTNYETQNKLEWNDNLTMTLNKLEHINNNCFNDFVKALNINDSEKLYKCIYKGINANQYTPIFLSTNDIKKELIKHDLKKIILKHLSEKVVGLVKSPESCGLRSPYLLSSSILIDNKLSFMPELSYLSQRLCRWSKAILKSKNMEFTLDNIKLHVSEILINRIN